MPEGSFWIAGIDEAGRGAVAGPMVIAGVCTDEKGEAMLKKMGVKDSKLLSANKRNILYGAIEKTVKDIAVISVGPCKIDSQRRSGLSLNRIEGMKMAEITTFLKPDKVYIDSPDRNIYKFQKQLEKMIQHEPEIVLEHKADLNYPIVAAASIIAKVERDKAVEKLREEHGNIGSGYPSDPVTTKWMENWMANNDRFPDFVRRTWIPAEQMEKDKSQSKLSSWFKNPLSR